MSRETKGIPTVTAGSVCFFAAEEDDDVDDDGESISPCQRHTLGASRSAQCVRTAETRLRPKSSSTTSSDDSEQFHPPAVEGSNVLLLKSSTPSSAANNDDDVENSLKMARVVGVRLNCSDDNAS